MAISFGPGPLGLLVVLVALTAVSGRLLGNGCDGGRHWWLDSRA
jgi:hypothetical protein